MNTTGTQLWFFHRGALGDSVLLWPALRAAQASGHTVTLVTDGSKARLAAAELKITGLDAEQERFNALWRPDAPLQSEPGVSKAFAFNTDQEGAWLAAAARMFPSTDIRPIHQRPDRLVVADLERQFGAQAALAGRANPNGPAILHVGAGSEEKRWPLKRFADLASRLERAGFRVDAIAGEVESDRFSDRDRAEFERIGGRYIQQIDELACIIKPARLYVGCDSGPTHLSAQFGVRTIALFGPSDPQRWAPVGPSVRVIAPPEPSPIEWLKVDVLLSSLEPSP